MGFGEQAFKIPEIQAGGLVLNIILDSSICCYFFHRVEKRCNQQRCRYLYYLSNDISLKCPEPTALIFQFRIFFIGLNLFHQVETRCYKMLPRLRFWLVVIVGYASGSKMSQAYGFHFLPITCIHRVETRCYKIYPRLRLWFVNINVIVIFQGSRAIGSI